MAIKCNCGILILCQHQCASDYLSEQTKNTNGLLRLYAYWRVLNKVWEKILVVSGRGYLRSVVQYWKPGKVIYLWKLNWVISTVKNLQGQVQGTNAMLGCDLNGNFVINFLMNLWV
ncbi:hypothetical protein AB3S75_016105 [Citrus x aurantiifolia]